jgi:protein-S-isoprenylcysteine O-methyltransferase Ste14
MAGAPTMNDAARHRLGSVLVGLQFTLIAVLAWLGAPAFLGGLAHPVAWLLLGLAVAVGLWAVQANRPGNFNIRPAPRAGGRLVHQGPYRWIRHPMYTAVASLAVACSIASGTVAAGLAALLLVAVLLGKAGLEERWMAEQHPGYAAYRAHTWRFVPGVF